MADAGYKIALTVLGIGGAAIMTSIWYRLGVLEEIKTEIKTMYKLFVSKENCDLKRQACRKGED